MHSGIRCIALHLTDHLSAHDHSPKYRLESNMKTGVIPHPAGLTRGKLVQKRRVGAKFFSPRAE